MDRKSFKIAGMNCINCVSKVERILRDHAEITHVTVDKENDLVTIEAPEIPDIKDMNAALGEYGHYVLSPV